MQLWCSIFLVICQTRISETLGKKLDGNYTRMQCVVLNKSRKQHPIKQQMHDHFTPFSQTIQIKQDMWRIAVEVKTNS